MRLGILVGAAAAALLLAFGGSATAAHKKSACQKLRGHDLAPAKRVKLVRKRVDSSETELRGCRLPRGKVRVLASSLSSDTTIEDFAVLAVSTTRYALLSARSDSQYGSDSEVWVVDISTGRVRYAIQSWACGISDSNCDPPPPQVGAGFVARDSRSVLALTTQSLTSIVAFTAKGARTEFDSGPPDQLPASSLRLKGTTASWMHSGETRSAELP